MSHAVLRGKATKAQTYLDGILEAVLASKHGKDIRNVGLSEILLYSMNANRSGIYMINGSTNESITNEQILKMAVPIARTLIAKGYSGKHVMMILRNDEYMAAVYYGLIFSGAIPILIDPNSTIYEFTHFNTLVGPRLIFCEQKKVEDITEILNAGNINKPEIVVADSNAIHKFTKSVSSNIDDFRIKHVNLDLPVLMLPTSGSTGLPKAAVLSNGGLIAQLPTLWTHHTRFPKPTDTAMLVSTAQWMTHTCLMTACPVYQITLLMTPTPTIDCLLYMIRRHKPTWALLGPTFANTLATAASSDDLASLETVLTTGAKPGPDIMKSLKRKLPKNVNLCNGYGTTETHGFITIPANDTPFESNGNILNIFEFKFQLCNESVEEVGKNEQGQLYLRSELCILKGYYKNIEAYEECVSSDGWWKTGDIFYQNNDGLMFFVERQKFWFKYLNYHISPEELESVIGSVPGVKECVVVETDKGPAAGVVRQPNYHVSENDINNIINSTLSEYKRLRGGIAFVTSLPRTHSGKLHRADCRNFINKMLGCQE
ncbi:probable 4-coumarate--CoA ligase 3 [Papilio machaon]|uniref:probable 4-coumarate--CoA ligase 3 n=1 Tax=Papilio machaon TaxID=76193 RepID=UPI001E665356|nr:probable 4-coumarate--CoA ligase 3 [Papilio machaon]